MKEKKLGMKWFNFFTVIVPIITIFEIIFIAISLFDAEYRSENFANMWLVGLQLFNYIELGMSLVLYFLTKKKCKHTPTYIHVLLIVVLFNVVYSSAVLESMINNSNYAVFILSFISLLIGLFLWYFPNLKYFEKRKWYFEKQEEAISDNVEQIIDNTRLNKIKKREKVAMAVLLTITALVLIVDSVVIEVKTDYISGLADKNYILQEKADFVDEHVVIVMEGDDKYYYTYDQFMALPDDQDVYYISVYTDVEAQSLGYEPWQD